MLVFGLCLVLEFLWGASASNSAKRIKTSLRLVIPKVTPGPANMVCQFVRYSRVFLTVVIAVCWADTFGDFPHIGY